MLLCRPAATSTSVTASVAPEVSVSVTSPAGGASHRVTFSFQTNARRRGHRALDVFGNFAIEKTEERVASVDQMHLDAERGESAGIFRADHAGANDCQGFRQHADLEDFIGVMHAGMLERKLRRAHR